MAHKQEYLPQKNAYLALQGAFPLSMVLPQTNTVREDAPRANIQPNWDFLRLNNVLASVRLENIHPKRG
jgi:hypothetical protein